jgi:hypothetical protein
MFVAFSTKAAAKSNLVNLEHQTNKLITQNSTTTTALNMLILIFKYKNCIDNRFSKLTPHEIALWCCKIVILEIVLENTD